AAQRRVPLLEISPDGPEAIQPRSGAQPGFGITRQLIIAQCCAQVIVLGLQAIEPIRLFRTVELGAGPVDQAATPVGLAPLRDRELPTLSQPLATILSDRFEQPI